MKVSTAMSAQKAVYDAIRAKPFTRVHGRPTRKSYDRLLEEACELASAFDVPYEWAGDHGLLAEVLGAEAYLRVTGKDYVEPVPVEPFNPQINQGTTEYQKAKKAAEYEEIREAWYTRKGVQQGIGENIRDALDESYYSQLRVPIIAYKGVKIVDYFNHLNNKWCKIDTRTIKAMKKEYYEPWDPQHHITELYKRLDDDQAALAANNIPISDEDKLQFFIEQMYESKNFDREQYVAWEKRPAATKTWAGAKEYFEELTNDIDEYEANIGGTAKRAKFESAANVDEGDDSLRQYFDSLAEAATADKEHIQQMSTTNSSMVTLSTTQQKQLEIKDAQITALIEQVKALTSINKTMSDKLANAGKANGEGNGGRFKKERAVREKTKAATTGEEKQRPEWLIKLCNIGGYCYSCGFDPIGKGHTSKTCKSKTKLAGHDEAATKCDRRGGSVANKPADFVL